MKKLTELEIKLGGIITHMLPEVTSLTRLSVIHKLGILIEPYLDEETKKKSREEAKRIVEETLKKWRN